MKKANYALLDTQIKAFLNPFIAQNHGEAIRLFTTWVNDKEQKTNVSLYPQHFTLFYLGEFDDQLGKYESDNKELIQGVSVQEEEAKAFTIKQLITMLETELKQRNVIDIASGE